MTPNVVIHIISMHIDSNNGLYEFTIGFLVIQNRYRPYIRFLLVRRRRLCTGYDHGFRVAMVISSLPPYLFFRCSNVAF